MNGSLSAKTSAGARQKYPGEYKIKLNLARTFALKVTNRSVTPLNRYGRRIKNTDAVCLQKLTRNGLQGNRDTLYSHLNMP